MGRAQIKITDRHPDLAVELFDHVAVVEIRRAPNNYFDVGLLSGLADIYEQLASEARCRAIVLAAEGKAFCAGTDHGKDEAKGVVSQVSRQAIRLFCSELPVVAAVHGPATGGGLGLALSADFRVTCPEARFWPNFSLLGLHAGFGLTLTLPRLVGEQKAAMLLYTGRRVGGDEAVSLGLVDACVSQAEVRGHALELAQQIAGASPLAVRSMRHSLRRGLVDLLEVTMERELLEQTMLRQSDDFREGVQAMADRRPPSFKGR